MNVLVRNDVRKSVFTKKFLQAAGEAAMLAAKADAELSIAVVGRAAIKKLNEQYRGVNKETDVLSFPLEEGEELISVERALGDVIICEPVLLEQAERLSAEPRDEFLTLLVHGVLHLLGYDHIDDADYKKMKAKERSLKAKAEKLLAQAERDK